MNQSQFTQGEQMLIEPDNALASLLTHLIETLAEMQRVQQIEIGFGQEGERLRAKLEDPVATPEEYEHRVGFLRNYYMAKIGLIMTEGGEALDELRKHEIGERYYSVDDNGNDKPEGVLSELSDVIIRILSLIGEAELGTDLALAMIEKMNYNTTRSFRHGDKGI